MDLILEIIFQWEGIIIVKEYLIIQVWTLTSIVFKLCWAWTFYFCSMFLNTFEEKRIVNHFLLVPCVENFWVRMGKKESISLICALCWKTEGCLTVLHQWRHTKYYACIREALKMVFFKEYFLNWWTPLPPPPRYI